MSILDSVEPDGYRMFDGEGNYLFLEELPDQASIDWSARYGREWEPYYSKLSAESLIEAVKAETRKEVLLEAMGVASKYCAGGAGSEFDLGMAHAASSIEDELRRMSESDKGGNDAR